MSTVRQLVTAEELFNMPNQGRCELIRGELRMMAPAGWDHGRILVNISTRLDTFVRERKLGWVLGAETGFLLKTNPDTVRAPDVAFIARERIPSDREQSVFFPGPPDLAVEVVSPSDRYSDVDDKVTDWLDAGCRMVIVVNPRKRTVAVHRGGSIQVLRETDVLEGGDVVPGWTLPLAAIFD